MILVVAFVLILVVALVMALVMILVVILAGVYRGRYGSRTAGGDGNASQRRGGFRQVTPDQAPSGERGGSTREK